MELLMPSSKTANKSPTPSPYPAPSHAEASSSGHDEALSALGDALHALGTYDPEIAGAIYSELKSQRDSLKLIASENYCSPQVQLAMSNWLTDKYAEGYPRHRFYAGCEQVDTIEQLAQERAEKLFGVDYAFVQPHCGADANILAYHAILTAKVQVPFLERLGVNQVNLLTQEQFDELRALMGKQKLLGMGLDAGGHLTHGYRMNLSARMFDVRSYGVNPQTHLIDYDQIEALAQEHRPLILLAGYSAYSRLIDYERMRQIADSVGAVLMGDIAHIAGLVAGKQLEGVYNPTLYCDILTTTTHKTLRGPRGGLVLCREWLRTSVQKACPLTMGGPLPHVMAAKAIAFNEALDPSFRDYSRRVIENARTLSSSLQEHSISVLTGGSDNHMLLLDLRDSPVTGMQAEGALRSIGVTSNRNALFADPRGAWITSGLRLGTAALTTRGMGEAQMREIAAIIADLLKAVEPSSDGKQWKLETALAEALKARVHILCASFNLYEGIEA